MTDTNMDFEGDNDENNTKQKARVIIPPPEIKAVVDKTASYVAKNGYSFEALIHKAEINNPKFNFLRHEDDPYRAYYIQKLNEFTGNAPKEAENG